MSKILITSRDNKGLHAVNLFEAAYNKAELDNDRAQRLNENGDKFQDGITKLIRELTASNQFSGEEVESNYVYPAGYKVKRITEQTNILRQLFPGIPLSVDENLASQPLMGWFAIPRWQKVAKTYNEAVVKVLELINQQCKGNFYNYYQGRLGAEYLRQHGRTAKMFQKLGDEQKDCDILIVSCQFGLRHRGRSVRRASEVFTANEFGLGAFAVGIMLLTHPERLVSRNNLWIDCAGDEYSPDTDGRFDIAPLFSFHGGKVRFDLHWASHAHERYGSASGFLPE